MNRLLFYFYFIFAMFKNLLISLTKDKIEAISNYIISFFTYLFIVWCQGTNTRLYTGKICALPRRTSFIFSDLIHFIYTTLYSPIQIWTVEERDCLILWLRWEFFQHFTFLSIFAIKDLKFYSNAFLDHDLELNFLEKLLMDPLTWSVFSPQRCTGNYNWKYF